MRRALSIKRDPPRRATRQAHSRRPDKPQRSVQARKPLPPSLQRRNKVRLRLPQPPRQGNRLRLGTRNQRQMREYQRMPPSQRPKVCLPHLGHKALASQRKPRRPKLSAQLLRRNPLQRRNRVRLGQSKVQRAQRCKAPRRRVSPARQRRREPLQFKRSHRPPQRKQRSRMPRQQRRPRRLRL